MKQPPIVISWQEGEPPPDLDEREMQDALTTFLQALGHGGCGVNLLVADDAVLQQFNRKFRNSPGPTDILSWSYDGEDDLLGELAISLERSRGQARDNGWDIRAEMLRLLAHGCAHLAGFDHQTPEEEKRMLAQEIAMLNAVGLEGIYPGQSGEAEGSR